MDELKQLKCMVSNEVIVLICVLNIIVAVWIMFQSSDLLPCVWDFHFGLPDCSFVLCCL